MKEFTIGTEFTINGRVRKMTKVNSKSVYFGRVRFDINTDEEAGTQYIMVDGERINADIINNAEETTTNINEEEITMAENKNIAVEEEVIETAATEETVGGITRAKEALATEEAPKTAAPKYTEYIVMKANQKDTTLWWDIVRKAKGENISDIINPLHEEDDPKFVALVAVDKVKKYLDDPTIKGMVQTVRDVTKKYAKVVGIENPTAGQAAQAFTDILAALATGATKGWWTAPETEYVTEDTKENGAA